MITSEVHCGWPEDVVIWDLDGTGLLAPSIVRPAKIATIDASNAPIDREVVGIHLRQRLSALG
jgi:hypothetical protein